MTKKEIYEMDVTKQLICSLIVWLDHIRHLNTGDLLIKDIIDEIVKYTLRK